MSPDLERLVGRAMSDKAFRDQLLSDPEGTIKSSGLSLSDDELRKVLDGISSYKSQGSETLDFNARGSFWV